MRFHSCDHQPNTLFNKYFIVNLLFAQPIMAAKTRATPIDEHISPYKNTEKGLCTGVEA
jgi:hypothetical protein